MRVDPRAGSGPLFPLLKSRGVKGVTLTQMTYGDIAIDGNGPGGMPVAIGIEYKKLGDMVQCIENGRFTGHQLPGMLESYDQIHLLVEGIWREGRSGLIEVPRGSSWQPMSRGMTASALWGFLHTMSNKLGLKVSHTGTTSQTVDWLYHLNRWWTEKEYEEHKAHLAFDNSAALSLVSRPSLRRRIAKELPGIGWGRSGDVARHFPSVIDMLIAGEQEWTSIKGIGKETARRVVRAIEEG